MAPVLMGGLVLGLPGARALCDAVGGPVATAAATVLEAMNVNLMLRYAFVAAELPLVAACERALIVRGKGPEAKA